jgi:PilX N-terminal
MQGRHGAVKPLGNECGIALVLAILLLMVISLFGAVGITMSTRELRGSGANRLGEQRFYEAHTGVRDALVQSGKWMDDDFLAQPSTEARKPWESVDPEGTTLAKVEILAIQDEDPALAAERGLPLQPHVTEPGEGYSMGKFQARRFSVTSTTAAETDRTVIREGVWRVFNK